MSGKALRMLVLCVAGLVVTWTASGCGKTAEDGKGGQTPAPEASGPVVDGDLSDAAWKGCEITGDWTDVSIARPVKDKPTVYLTCDDRNLYVAFLNPESRMKDLVADARDHDGNVWEDDSNEIFIDPTGKKQSYYQVIVNSLGVVRDARDQDTEWESKATAKVKKTDDAWSVEVAIPLTSLGVEGSPRGQTWAFNFCRNRQVTGMTENQAWVDTGPSFHNPEAFRKITLK
ncbi:MAG TPA: sugar-binding protein [Planctomycetota bacterium]|nr:sugar-binding protein [Planctomycetota bacterium]